MQFNNMNLVDMDQISDTDTFRVSLDQSLLVALEDESRWAVKNGLVRRKNIPNYLDFTYLEGLRSVKPEAVNIIR